MSVNTDALRSPPAIDTIAAHCDAYSAFDSVTMRTARSMTSGENFEDFFIIAPFSQMMEPPSNPGRFMNFAGAAVEWLRARADAGDAQAQQALGWLRESGVAVDQDDARAVEWYARASHGGDPVGQFNYALRCERGRGVPMDLAAAARWYLASAEQGRGSRHEEPMQHVPRWAGCRSGHSAGHPLATRRRGRRL